MHYFGFGRHSLNRLSRYNRHGGCGHYDYGEWPEQEGVNAQSLSPMDVLKIRYAKGEITKEEFERIKEDLMR